MLRASLLDLLERGTWQARQDLLGYGSLIPDEQQERVADCVPLPTDESEIPDMFAALDAAADAGLKTFTLHYLSRLLDSRQHDVEEWVLLCVERHQQVLRDPPSIGLWGPFLDGFASVATSSETITRLYAMDPAQSAERVAESPVASTEVLATIISQATPVDDNQYDDPVRLTWANAIRNPNTPWDTVNTFVQQYPYMSVRAAVCERPDAPKQMRQDLLADVLAAVDALPPPDDRSHGPNFFDYLFLNWVACDLLEPKMDIDITADQIRVLRTIDPPGKTWSHLKDAIIAHPQTSDATRFDLLDEGFDPFGSIFGIDAVRYGVRTNAVSTEFLVAAIRNMNYNNWAPKIVAELLGELLAARPEPRVADAVLAVPSMPRDLRDRATWVIRRAQLAAIPHADSAADPPVLFAELILKGNVSTALSRIYGTPDAAPAYVSVVLGTRLYSLGARQTAAELLAMTVNGEPETLDTLPWSVFPVLARFTFMLPFTGNALIRLAEHPDANARTLATRVVMKDLS